MTLREKIEVMEAFERGEEIECNVLAYKGDSWCDDTTPDYVIEGTKEFMSGRSEKVKLLDTYEVEL